MALSGKLIPLDSIIEKVQSNFKFNVEFDWQDAAEWVASLLALLDVPSALVQKVTDGHDGNPQPIKIEDYRGNLPCDLHSIIQTSRDFSDAECSGDVRLVPMRYATDTFHTRFHCEDCPDLSCSSGETYIVNNNHIFTNFKEGTVYMSYLAIPTDERGFPMVPYEESWRKAMEWEIAYRIAFILFLRDEISGDKFQLIERDRDWYSAQAVHKAKMPSIDEWESIKNNVIRSIPKINHHRDFFKNMQMPEERYIWPLRRELNIARPSNLR